MDKKRNYMDWDCALELIYKLIEDEKYSIALVILIGINTGFRIDKIRKLRWINILNEHEIKIDGVSLLLNDDFYTALNHIYKCLGEPDKTSYILLSHKKMPYSTQRINILFKEINVEYNLGIDNFTTHSLRKTFGRRIVEQSKNTHAALSALAKYFNHASVSITLEYLSLEEFKEKCYPKIGVRNSGYFNNLIQKTKEKKSNPGYCYLMKDDNYPNLVKIGISITPIMREKTLAHQIPTISLYKVVKTENMREIENALHKQYENKRIRGEWYKLTDEDVNNIIEQYHFIDYPLPTSI
jgi:hypothetical protein